MEKSDGTFGDPADLRQSRLKQLPERKSPRHARQFHSGVENFFLLPAFRYVFLDGHEMGNDSLRIPDGRYVGRVPEEPAVLPAIAQLPMPGFSGKKRFPHAFVEYPRMRSGFQDSGVPAQNLFGVVPRHFDEFRVHVFDRSVAVRDDHRNGTLRHGPPKLLQFRASFLQGGILPPEKVHQLVSGRESEIFPVLLDPFGRKRTLFGQEDRRR